MYERLFEICVSLETILQRTCSLMVERNQHLIKRTDLNSTINKFISSIKGAERSGGAMRLVFYLADKLTVFKNDGVYVVDLFQEIWDSHATIAERCGMSDARSIRKWESKAEELDLIKKTQINGKGRLVRLSDSLIYSANKTLASSQSFGNRTTPDRISPRLPPRTELVLPTPDRTGPTTPDRTGPTYLLKNLLIRIYYIKGPSAPITPSALKFKKLERNDMSLKGHPIYEMLMKNRVERLNEMKVKKAEYEKVSKEVKIDLASKDEQKKRKKELFDKVLTYAKSDHQRFEFKEVWRLVEWANTDEREQKLLGKLKAYHGVDKPTLAGHASNLRLTNRELVDQYLEDLERPERPKIAVATIEPKKTWRDGLSQEEIDKKMEERRQKLLAMKEEVKKNLFVL